MVFGWGRKKRREEGEEPAAAAAGTEPDEGGGQAAAGPPREVSLPEVGPILDSLYRERADHLVEQTRRLQRPVAGHIESLLRIAAEIEKDELDTERIDTNIITIVRRGKKRVLDTIRRESQRRLPEVNSVEDAKEFDRTARQILNKIGDILGKQTRVLHVFAKKHAGRLKGVLAEFTEDLDRSKRLLERFAEFEECRGRVSELVSRISSEGGAARAHSEKIAALERSASARADELADLDGRIARFKASANYARYREVRRRMGDLEERRSRTERQINNQTILISRPLSKYGYGSALDKETRAIAENLLSSPLEVFLEANRGGIVTVLESVRRAIASSNLSVKEPEKALGYIDDIMSKVDGFIGSVESLASEGRALRGELEALDMHVLEGYQKRRSKAAEDMAFSRSRIGELRAEIDSLESNTPSYVAEIESAMNGLGGARYAVRGGRGAG